MSYKLTPCEMNNLFNDLSEKYEIWAPKRFIGRGRFSDTDLIKYDKVKSFSEIEYKEKSNGSPKEVVIPITQTIFYFNNNKYTVPDITEKDILIFARPCDINAMSKLDTIYLDNGEEDFYYKRIRDKVKFVLIECTEGYDNCFCVSMETNKSTNYSLACRFNENETFVEVKDKQFNVFFDNFATTEFKPEFIKENKQEVTVPFAKELPEGIYNSEIWSSYERCINCGRCTLNCPTCSCFTTSDLFYTENSNVGERRRVWTSCHMDNYTNMAGGHSFRNTSKERARFKVLHKMYDFNKRFDEGHMCVGCGRCEDQCPEYISYIKVANKLGSLLEEDNNNEK